MLSIGNPIQSRQTLSGLSKIRLQMMKSRHTWEGQDGWHPTDKKIVNDDIDFSKRGYQERNYSQSSSKQNQSVSQGGNVSHGFTGGGLYVPPAKRRQPIKQYGEINSKEDNAVLQEQTWIDQKRIIHGTINRLNETTIKPLIHELFQRVNLIRLRGVLARNLLQAALTSTQYSSVYASLVAVINTKLPEVGELVCKRAILAFRRHYRRREKSHCLAVAIFLGHLFHQAVVHELLVLQILTLLLDGDPTDDSVEVAVEFLITVGQALLEVSPAGMRAVMDRLRSLLHEGILQKRVEYKMESLIKMRKTAFRDCPAPIPKELDLVERDDQITFEISLDDEEIQIDDELDFFRLDDQFDENEATWSKIRAEILGLDDSNGDEDSDGDEETDEESEDDANQQNNQSEELSTIPPKSDALTTTIQDLSESDLVHLRRQIYLTIMSSATFEECTHKLTQIHIPKGRESELINMIIECCSQERTFLRYYGLIGARFCLLDDRWLDAFLEAFAYQYTTIHRLETNKLRNVAKLFAHLLHTDSIPWRCFSIIHLNENETTSSSRIFVKILIQEMAEALGIAGLKQRFDTSDPLMTEWYSGMFPFDDIRKTRYAINFFTSIGLGPLTDGMREFLKNAPKMILAQAAAAKKAKEDEKSLSSSGSSSSSSKLSTSSSSSSSSSSCSTSSRSSSSTSSSSSSYSSRHRRRSRRRRTLSSGSSSSSDSNSSSSQRKPRVKRNHKVGDRQERNVKSDRDGCELSLSNNKDDSRPKNNKDSSTCRSSASNSHRRTVLDPKSKHDDDSSRHSSSRKWNKESQKDIDKKHSSKRSLSSGRRARRKHSSSSSSSSSSISSTRSHKGGSFSRKRSDRIHSENVSDKAPAKVVVLPRSSHNKETRDYKLLSNRDSKHSTHDQNHGNEDGKVVSKRRRARRRGSSSSRSSFSSDSRYSHESRRRDSYRKLSDHKAVPQSDQALSHSNHFRKPDMEEKDTYQGCSPVLKELDLDTSSITRESERSAKESFRKRKDASSSDSSTSDSNKSRREQDSNSKKDNKKRSRTDEYSVHTKETQYQSIEHDSVKDTVKSESEDMRKSSNRHNSKIDETTLSSQHNPPIALEESKFTKSTKESKIDGIVGNAPNSRSHSQGDNSSNPSL